ncbi:hypothetical protein Pcinc_005945 [Petrolisthes cinctipes]|uniref:Uncharacterized protein n=1 Tax=Petrolisthes cinctipes TaxID=88211 RepID=A0AAE1GCD8_PETCI|nr:hypothetical protein Pcinc_005945 [Petrolisthes cinctipes]
MKVASVVVMEVVSVVVMEVVSMVVRVVIIRDVGVSGDEGDSCGSGGGVCDGECDADGGDSGIYDETVVAKEEEEEEQKEEEEVQKEEQEAVVVEMVEEVQEVEIVAAMLVMVDTEEEKKKKVVEETAVEVEEDKQRLEEDWCSPENFLLRLGERLAILLEDMTVRGAARDGMLTLHTAQSRSGSCS